MKRIRQALAATFILLMASGAAFFIIKQGKMQGQVTPAQNENNCGMDSLLRICHQNEILISAEDLRANYGTSNLSSFLEIKEAAEKLGFIAKGYRMNLGEMDVYPPYIFLKPDPNDGTFKGILTISCLTNRKYSIESVSSNLNYMNLTLKKDKGGDRYIVNYEGTLPKLVTSGESGKILIRTNVPQQSEIQIPVFLPGK